MTLRVGEVVIDCAEHGAVVDFWQAALDYDRQDVNEQYVGLAPRDKEPGRPPILFQKVPEAKTVKNRVHLDFRAESMADEVVRLQGLGATWDFYFDVYGRQSIDDEGLPLDATVHFGSDYNNAFWNGHQMVFGDGDGELFNRFTIALDVIGHELTHGVTEATAGLLYQGQSGALNESVSDVFGSLVKQRVLGQDATGADWLIGAGLFTAAVQGVALRSMRAPGTAYDDDVLGRDPQPDHLRGYVETSDDNGGVHINSGIPNHAFYLAATSLGGSAWEVAGRIWYDTLVSGGLKPDADFVTFAAATVQAAQARFGTTEVLAVRSAWDAVGVTG